MAVMGADPAKPDPARPEPARPVRVGHHLVGPGQPLLLIAGPCVIETADQCLAVGEFVAGLAARLGLGYVFKASFDKANRTSAASFRGPGLHEGLAILDRLRRTLGVPVTSDVHETAQMSAAGQVLDLIQIPAFLCRQTDLVVAAAATGRPVNIKKGQFVSPAEMANAAAKVRDTPVLAGALPGPRVLLTERGTTFGYNRLVNDMTAIPDMAALGCPVVFDATHSTQQPGALGGRSGGRPEMAAPLARAAVAAGADGVFVECHPNPPAALSDAATVQPLTALEALLAPCVAIRAVVCPPSPALIP